MSKQELAMILAALDSANALVVVYILQAITHAYGLGSARARLQLLHRAGMVLLSLAFAWHAADVLSSPGEHGLSASNFSVHVVVMGVFVVSAMRINRATKIIAKAISIGLPVPRVENGGLISGPFVDDDRAV